MQGASPSAATHRGLRPVDLVPSDDHYVAGMLREAEERRRRQQQQEQVPQTRNDEEEAEGDGEVERLGGEIARLNTSSPNAQSLEGEGEGEERPNSITRPLCPVCLKAFRGRIFCCQECDHGFCEPCLLRLTSWAMCRGSFEGRRPKRNKFAEGAIVDKAN